jgi:transposase
MLKQARMISVHREAELNEQLRQEREKNEALRLENQLLRQKLDALARRIFGKSSEKLDAAQLELLLDGMEEIAAVNATATPQPQGQQSKARKERERGPRLPEHLPIKEIIIEPEEVKAAPDQWRCIGEEVSEQLDYIPGSFRRLRLIRRKYVHREQRHLAPIIAPLSPMLQERCLAAPSLLAHAFTSRYRDHLPWYRLEAIYAALGVEVSRQNLCNWSGMAAAACGLVVKEIGRDVFADGCVQIDETPIEYLVPGHGQTKTGYLWAVNNPVRERVLFVWHTSRAAACLESIVPRDFKGVIQCDGYSAYDAFAGGTQRAGQIQLAGCWAHVRRGFFEAREHTPDAAWVLTQIQALYHIEEQLREARAGPDIRKSTRQDQSRALIESIHQQLLWLERSHAHLPQSLMGQAMRYALGQWESLLLFLEDGRIEIDNNLCENEIRPSAIGKKNWLFIGDAKAGDRAAVFYTLIGNCRRLQIDPQAYLEELFTKLPAMTNHQIAEITPAAWAKNRAQQTQPVIIEA